MRSEFGRGYAVCLRQVIWHKTALLDPYGTLIFSAGASDHIHDLVRPKRGISKADWQEAEALRADLLDLYWNVRPRETDTSRAEKDVRIAERLLDTFAERMGRETPMTYEEAWDLDVAAGLSPVRGDAATCTKWFPIRQGGSNGQSQ